MKNVKELNFASPLTRLLIVLKDFEPLQKRVLDFLEKFGKNKRSNHIGILSSAIRENILKVTLKHRKSNCFVEQYYVFFTRFFTQLNVYVQNLV